jgi:hypothetical protein
MLLLIACALTVQASTTPDLSGRWVLVEPARPSPGAPAEVEVANSQDDGFTTMTVAWRTGAEVRTERHRVGLHGGTVGAGGHQTRQSARWTFGMLVIERESSVESSRGTQVLDSHVEVWAVEPDGRLLIRITRRTRDAEPVVTSLVYRRP